MNTDTATKAAETPPRFLYKYLDHYGLDAIYNLELKITPPNEFNDPFEFFARLSDTQKERDAVLRRAQKVNPGIIWQQVEAKGLKRSLDGGMPRKIRDEVSKEFVVLCLSERPDTPTQWAHYANKHDGLVLKLDMDAEPFQSYRVQPNHKPLFPFGALLSTGQENIA